MDGDIAAKKRDAAAADLEERERQASGKRRLELGDDLPEEIAEEDIQRMLDQADDVHIENLNEATLKRMVLQLERKIKSNQEQRIKFNDDPEKFLKSEVDLDEEVKKFTLLAAHP